MIKNNLKLITLGIVALGLVFGSNSIKYRGQQKISSKEDNYSIYVPKEWNVEYADPSPEIDVSGAFAYDDAKDSFIFVVVSPDDTPEYEDDFANWEQQFKLVEFEYINKNEVAINGTDAMAYESTIMNGTVPYYQTGFLTYKDGKKYMILGQCREENKELMIPIYEKSFNTFKLK